MRRAIITLLVLLSFGLKAQVYQAMPQAGYGPVKRMLFDSVLTIPLNINQLRNITGGRDAGQIRYNVSDSGLYVFTGYTWIKANLDSVNLSNRINGKLNISDTAYMLSWYMRKTDTLSLSNRINLRVKYSDTAQMLLPYLRKLDTASLSRRIDKKQDSITLTTNFKSGAATLIGATLNIPKYSDTLQDNYVPYTGANKDVDLGVYKLNANTLQSDYLLQVKNSPTSIAPTKDYTAITGMESGLVLYSSWMTGNTTYTQQNFINYANTNLQNNTRQYNLPVRDGTLALVEDTVNLSNRINLKADKATVLTINGVGYDLSANRTWTIPVFDSTSLSNRLNLKLNISDTAAMLSPYLKSAVTSVGLSMPNAFTVANSPITSTGTIAVTGAGTAAQYIRGDGQLATLPSGVSGGSSVNYYLNGSVNQGTIGGSVYYEMNKTSVLGAGTDFALAGNGLISQFITDVADPNRLQIPAGNWNFEIYMSASSSGGNPEFYVELLKYDGTNFTSIASSSANPEAITNGTTIDLYLTALAIPQTTLLATDRLAIRVYIVNSTGGRTITMHTENSHLCEIITNFAGGVSALNGLTANTQYLAVGTSGNDFAINSLTDTHTFDLPTASSTKRGALSSTDWSTFNGKMNYSDTVSLSNRINLKLNSSDTISLSNRINTKLNATDTASLSNRINAKADALSGTTNTVPKFTSATTIGNSNIKDDGSAVSVSTTAGSNGALQVGSYNGNILMNTTNTTAGLIFKNTSSSNKLWDISSFNNDLNFNESNISPTVMTLKAGGDVIISNLSGSGTRMVVASSTGVLSTQSITGVDTTSLSNRINLKLNISDTASMLSGYQSGINSKQPQLSGTGFVKASGTTISYDNSTYYLASNPNGYGTGTVTSVTGTSPIVSSGGTTPAISIPAATSSVNGYLSSSDWTNFNNKGSGTVTSVAALTLGTSGTDLSSTVANSTTTPVITLNVPTASATNRGALSSADWTTFNNKVSSATLSGYLPLTAGSSYPLTGVLTINKSGEGLRIAGVTSGNATFQTWYDFVGNRRGYFGYSTGGSNLFELTNETGGLIGLNGGNVGINTTTDAGYKLDVNGTGRFSGAITINSNTTGVTLNRTAVTNYTGIGYLTGGVGQWFVGMRENLSSNNYVIYNENGTDALTISKSNSNVGIGTASPTDYSGFTTLHINGKSGSNGGVLRLTAFDNSSSFNIYAGGSTANFNTTSAIPIIFLTQDAERMRITSGGLVGIGTGSSVSGYGFFGVGGSVTISSLAGVIAGFSDNINGTLRLYSQSGVNGINTDQAFAVSTGGTSPTERLRIASGGSVTMSSLGTGTVTASSGTLSTVSDSSYKIADGFIEDALPSVMNLKPRYFYWKDKSGLDTTIRQLGFYAQEVNSAIGEEAANTPKKDSPWGITDRSLIAFLTKAIQELSVKNEALIKRIETLENK